MFERLGSSLASRPKRAAILLLTLAVAFILVLAGFVLVLTHSGEAPYPSQNVSIHLVDGKVIYTQESTNGNIPYTGMKMRFRVAVSGGSTTMPVEDFGSQSRLGANIPATVHVVLMSSSWVNASIDLKDSTGDGAFDEGDTIAFELVPLTEDMVFTLGLLWTPGDGGGAILEFSFVVHDGRLYAWYSQYLNDWYNSYLTDLRKQTLGPAVSYLYDNYNASIGLIHVSPDTEELNNTYYIYSDNYLASLVLANYDKGNLALTRRAESIRNTMQHYLDLAGIANPVNQYTVLNQSVFAFNASADFTLEEVNGSAIRTTMNNQSGSLDPSEYADIAFLQAVYYHELGREDDAMRVYLDGTHLYDGRGFNDTAFTGNYQTYKLALYIYASKLLGQDYNQLAYYTLLGMQQSDGGFATSYNYSLGETSGTNVETTSLAILSLNMQSLARTSS